MKTYRITKYNPSKRNEQGHYLDNNEWTSISDLKNLDEYFKVESAYVNAILTILQHFKISRLYAVFIEKHTNEEDFNSSCDESNAFQLSLDDININLNEDKCD